jgi:PPM family protein phosphatase
MAAVHLSRVRRVAPKRPRTTIKLSSGGSTHRGHVRESNQDVILVEPGLGIYAVLDGMGGANAGDVAAQLAGQEIKEFLRKKPRIWRRSAEHMLRLALDHAAIEVYLAAERQLEYRGMGTTVVACLVVDPTRVLIAHAGDSRAYLLRSGELVALTSDHTVAQRMIKDGARRVDKASKNTLTRNLGMAYGVRADIVEQLLEPGDRLLLCSDGLYRGTSTRAIIRILSADEAPDRVAQRLVDVVLRGKARDNISAVVIAADQHTARPATRGTSSRS